MKLFVHHDEKGQVLSVAKVHAGTSPAQNPFVYVDSLEHVLEIEATKEVGALHAHEIAERYEVDMKKRNLRKKGLREVPVASEKEVKKKSRKG